MNFPKAALYISVIVLSLTLSVSAQQTASTQPSSAVPRLVKYSGVLKDAAGKPRSGTVGLTLAIYAEQEGGAALWLETQNAELDEQGRYTVLLGAQTKDGLPLDLFTAGEARWLGVQVNLPGEVEQPRVLLVSVPYALKAADAETLGGKPVSAFVLAAGPSDASSGGKGVAPRLEAILAGGAQGVTATTSGGTVNFLAKFDSSGTNLVNSSISDNGSRISIAEGVDFTSGSRINIAGGVDFSSDFSFTGNAEPAATGRVQLFDRAFQGFVIRGLNTIFETLQPNPTEALRITSTGRVGIGTNAPGQKLSVAGVIESTTGGFKFPDGTTQTSAGPGGSLAGEVTGPQNATVVSNAVSANTANAIVRRDASGNFAAGTITLGGNLTTAGVISSAEASFTGVSSGSIVAVAQNGTGSGLVTAISGTGGAAILGLASSQTGPTVGLLGSTSSPDGIAGVFQSNDSAGKILVGKGPGGTEVFAVDANGRITTASVGAAALVPDQLTVSALTFNGDAFSKADFTKGLIQGPAKGFANVSLPDGSSVLKFRACGRDVGDPDQFIARLKRKSIQTSDSPLALPELLVEVSSGASFSQDVLTCAETTSITTPTIDNSKYTYFIEIDLQGTAQLIAVQIERK